MMKKKSKKLLLWLFVLTFVLTGIAGCGTKQKDDQEAASTETAGAISGVAESYWGKNKGRSMEGNLEKFTKIAAVLIFVLALVLNLKVI